MSDRPHPMRGPNRLKLGVFSANADGGLTLTRVPERWRAEWPDVVAVAQMADRAGWSSSCRSPGGGASVA